MYKRLEKMYARTPWLEPEHTLLVGHIFVTLKRGTLNTAHFDMAKAAFDHYHNNGKRSLASDYTVNWNNSEHPAETRKLDYFSITAHMDNRDSDSPSLNVVVERFTLRHNLAFMFYPSFLSIYWPAHVDRRSRTRADGILAYDARDVQWQNIEAKGFDRSDLGSATAYAFVLGNVLESQIKDQKDTIPFVIPHARNPGLFIGRAHPVNLRQAGSHITFPRRKYVPVKHPVVTCEIHTSIGRSNFQEPQPQLYNLLKLSSSELACAKREVKRYSLAGYASPRSQQEQKEWDQLCQRVANVVRSDAWKKQAEHIKQSFEKRTPVG